MVTPRALATAVHVQASFPASCSARAQVAARALCELGVPWRDVHLLSSPLAPAMLRMRASKALLVSLDALRLVLASDQVYVLSAPLRGSLARAGPATSDNAFVRDLVFRLRAPPAAACGSSAW